MCALNSLHIPLKGIEAVSLLFNNWARNRFIPLRSDFGKCTNFYLNTRIIYNDSIIVS